MDWSALNTYKTSYETWHSGKSFRPQMRLYSALHNNPDFNPPVDFSRKQTTHRHGGNTIEPKNQLPFSHVTTNGLSFQTPMRVASAKPKLEKSGFAKNNLSGDFQSFQAGRNPDPLPRLFTEYTHKFCPVAERTEII